MGLIIGAVTTATLTVALGSLLRPVEPRPVQTGLVLATALFVVAGDCGLHRITLPHRRAQVPSTVIAAGGDAGALRFGFEMGCGARTHMPSNLPYLPLVTVLLVSSWPAALVTGLGFGLGRAAMALGRHHSRDGTWWDHQWRHHERPLRIALALAAALVAGALVLLP